MCTHLTTHPTAAGPLATTDQGAGEPALLFIPGWCGDRTVFDDLMAGAAPRRRAISIDLPGHGESPYIGDYTSADLVDAVVATIETAGIGRVVPVALSHAGWAAIALRRRLGARVPGLILLDWMVLGTPPGFADALTGLQSPHWAQVRESLRTMWIGGLDIPPLAAYLASMAGYGQRHWARAGREIAAGFAAQPVPLHALDTLQPCSVLHLYAQPASDQFLQEQQAYAATHRWFAVERLHAASHFPMFEVPGLMAARIEQFTRSLP